MVGKFIVVVKIAGAGLVVKGMWVAVRLRRPTELQAGKVLLVGEEGEGC